MHRTVSRFHRAATLLLEIVSGAAVPESGVLAYHRRTADPSACLVEADAALILQRLVELESVVGVRERLFIADQVGIVNK